MAVFFTFVALAALAVMYWLIAKIAPRRGPDKVPGYTLPQITESPETWRAAHQATEKWMTIVAVVATVFAVLLPGALLLGQDLPAWAFPVASFGPLVAFLAGFPTAMKAAKSARRSTPAQEPTEPRIP